MRSISDTTHILFPLLSRYTRHMSVTSEYSNTCARQMFEFGNMVITVTVECKVSLSDVG